MAQADDLFSGGAGSGAGGAPDPFDAALTRAGRWSAAALALNGVSVLLFCAAVPSAFVAIYAWMQADQLVEVAGERIAAGDLPPSALPQAQAARSRAFGAMGVAMGALTMQCAGLSLLMATRHVWMAWLAEMAA